MSEEATSPNEDKVDLELPPELALAGMKNIQLMFFIKNGEPGITIDRVPLPNDLEGTFRITFPEPSLSLIRFAQAVIARGTTSE